MYKRQLPGHLISTSDDDGALALADNQPTVTVRRGPDDALTMTGPQRDVSSYIGTLLRADIDLLAYTPTETPLEALFFMLTDTESDTDGAGRQRFSHRQKSGAVR